MPQLTWHEASNHIKNYTGYTWLFVHEWMLDKHNKDELLYLKAWIDTIKVTEDGTIEITLTKTPPTLYSGYYLRTFDKKKCRVLLSSDDCLIHKTPFGNLIFEYVTRYHTIEGNKKSSILYRYHLGF